MKRPDQEKELRHLGRELRAARGPEPIVPRCAKCGKLMFRVVENKLVPSDKPVCGACRPKL